MDMTVKPLATRIPPQPIVCRAVAMQETAKARGKDQQTIEDSDGYAAHREERSWRWIASMDTAPPGARFLLENLSSNVTYKPFHKQVDNPSLGPALGS